MTNPSAIAAGPVAAGTPTVDEQCATIDAAISEINDLRETNAALLAACEMMLVGWTEMTDAMLEEDAASTNPAGGYARNCRAVLAMRAAVKRARGERI